MESVTITAGTKDVEAVLFLPKGYTMGRLIVKEPKQAAKVADELDKQLDCTGFMRTAYAATIGIDYGGKKPSEVVDAASDAMCTVYGAPVTVIIHNGHATTTTTNAEEE